MPRQNRVDPCGNIVAHPARGMLMGNRGCLHDAAGKIVRSTDRAAWITCLPTWPGIRRKLMAPGQYTELFFLDEATALAAGHRPCGSCRPEALIAFKQAWAVGHCLPYLPRVAEIDRSLRHTHHNETITIDGIPNGTMIDAEGTPMLHWDRRWLRWSFEGYRPSCKAPAVGTVLTPVPAQKVLTAGYAPMLHRSVLDI